MRRALLLLALLVAGCADAEAPTPSGGPAPKGRTTESHDASVQQVSTPLADRTRLLGSLRGTVRWLGPRPQPRQITMEGRAGLQMRLDGPVPDPRFEVAEDGGLPHAFVCAVRGPHAGWNHLPPERPAELAARVGMFVPRVVGVQVGQELRLTSDGTDGYCFLGKPRENPPFHPELAEAGSASLRFSTPERAIPVIDEVLGWMVAYVFVVEHPFHAVTDASGRFAVDGLEAGDYVFRVWREGFTADRHVLDTTFPVAVRAGAETEVAFELR